MTTAETIAVMQNLMNELRRLGRKVEKLRDRTRLIGGGVSDGMPKGAAKDGARFAGDVIELRDTQAEMAKLLVQLDGHRAQMAQCINRLPLGSMRTALQMWLIEYKPIVDIAQILHYDRAYVYKLIRQGVDALDSAQGTVK
ncbi:MAG: hypothetical protein RR653_12295 [Clostridia bacterium]